MISVNNEHSLWVEKYRPATLADYVGNEAVKSKVQAFLESREVPNLLLFGTAGTGKTSLAKLIASQIDCDLLYVNASDENNVETVREKIKNFATTMSFHTWKIVILDECDYMTVNGQAALRNLMESCSKTTRFILTCNYVEKVIDPLKSRCQTLKITPPSMPEVAKRVADILNNESVTFDLKDVADIVKSGFPDLRKVINTVHSSVRNNKLVPDKQSQIESSYSDKIIQILKDKKSKKDVFVELRQHIADSKVKDFAQLYSTLYESLDEWATGHIGPCILIIADAMYKDSFCVDKEINVMSMFVQLVNELF